MTKGQALRKLQLAVDHIDAVLGEFPSAIPELSEALDLIHQAEGEVSDSA